MFRRCAASAFAFGVTIFPVQAADICTTSQTRDPLKFVSYFLSRVQDVPECAMKIVDGRVSFDPKLTNPAMSCPDMFAWKLFAEAVTAQFWRNWAADQETWPGNGLMGDQGRPYPLCQQGQPTGACCNPEATNNPGYDDPTYKAKFCPFYPGDHPMLADQMPVRIGMLPSKAHTLGFASSPNLRASFMEEATLAQQILEAPDPTKGRHIRQSMAEVVFRNKSFFDYVFRNDLYNTEGITKRFTATANNIASSQGNGGAPYRLDSSSSEIVFPADAVMIKSDWISRERAEKMGLRDDPEYPFVKMSITSPVLDDNGTILQPGEHWLVAIHFSSKDIPNWVWTTFEHVNNPGRCDYTGCNDSYGYNSSDAVKEGQAQNYTRPHEMCDGLLLPSYVLDLGKTYPGGQISSGLKDVFTALHIGIADNPTLIPQPSDRAWLSYRLKGAQVEFTDATGRSTHLGNSVTEAGFVTSSSCMTCHARAGANAAGTVPPPLGVFENGLTDSGYLPSSNGIPNPDWYNRSGQPPSLQVLQTDFAWGFLLANPIAQPALTASVSSARRLFLGSIRQRAQE